MWWTILIYIGDIWQSSPQMIINLKKKKVYLTVNTWFGRPPLRPNMVAGIEATHLPAQLLCKSGIQYVFEMNKYIHSEKTCGTLTTQRLLYETPNDSLKVKVKVQVFYSLISSLRTYHRLYILPHGHWTCSFMCHFNSPGSIQSCSRFGAFSAQEVNTSWDMWYSSLIQS